MSAAPERAPAFFLEGGAEAARERAEVDLVRELFTALQLRRLRGPADPRTLAAVALVLKRLRECSEPGGRVRLYRNGPHLLVERVRVGFLPESRLAARAIWVDLERLGIGGFEFAAGLAAGDLDAFLEIYPKLQSVLKEKKEWGEAGSTGKRQLVAASPLVKGVTLLPPLVETAGALSTEEERRSRARRAFFRALAGARSVVRQVASQKIPELRKSRAIVHELVDSLVDEEFSLMGLSAIQNFDSYTFQHSVHVSVLSMVLGQGLGLTRRDLADLGVAALFHDVGKVHVPKQVLEKPGRFDSREWSVMRTHPLAGARELLRLGGTSELAAKVMLVSVEHHMRFDGSGYPSLGEGWEQGLFSRIVSVADCYDAMTASRAYMQRPFTPDAVVRYMVENAGRMFDPDLLRLFVEKIGCHPVGSVLRLESGELGLVTRPPAGPREIEHPCVRLLDRSGGAWCLGAERELAEGSSADPRRRILASCHPLDHGIDVDLLLSRHYS